MSATIDTVKFQNYFKTNCADIDIYPPTLHILKESDFNNQLFYIDQLSSLGKVKFLLLICLNIFLMIDLFRYF